MSSGTVAGIQGQPLEVTVVSCSKLKDTEWISRQDPYVSLEYASTKFRTRTCTDGGKHPVFQEKFVVPLIEGLRELTVVVWNSNTLKFDDFIGTGKVQLNKVLSQGFDDSCWPLQTKSGRHAGEIKLILHYANAKLNQQKVGSSSTHTPTSYGAPPTAPSYYPQQQQQQQQQPSYSNYHHPTPPPALAYPQQPYHPPPAAASHNSYHYPPPSTYPSMPSPYPPPSSSPYPPPPHSAYPPTSAYPRPSYPPPATYPPNPGMYPPPPY